MVPKYSHHKGSGQAFVKISGKYVYLGKYGSKASRQKYADVILGTGAEVPLPVDPSVVTIGSMVTLFLERNPSEYSATSPEPRQFGYALEPLVSECGAAKVSDFQAFHLDTVRKAMAKAGLCREVINRRLARIKLCFKRSELWQVIPPGTYARLAVVTGADTKARRAPEIRPATFADVMAVVRHLLKPGKRRHKARGRLLASMLLLQWWTGARPGEIRIMRGADIDTSGDVWIYRPGTHKNAWRGQPRDIPLGPKCQAILGKLLGGDPEAWLFPSKAGAYTLWGYTNAVRLAAKAAGVALHPYAIRHGSKRRVENEHGPVAAKAFLGQESMDSTKKYARQQDLELAKKIAGKAG